MKFHEILQIPMKKIDKGSKIDLLRKEKEFDECLLATGTAGHCG